MPRWAKEWRQATLRTASLRPLRLEPPEPTVWATA
jgi:hypothetical protein